MTKKERQAALAARRARAREERLKKRTDLVQQEDIAAELVNDNDQRMAQNLMSPDDYRSR